MSEPKSQNEFPEVEVQVEGDVPDVESLDGGMAAPTSNPADVSAVGPEEEPMVGRLEDVENGSSVGWSD